MRWRLEKGTACDRGQEIGDATPEANVQTIFDQSENRLHVQKAVLLAVAKT